jgi:hypothetical protein
MPAWMQTAGLPTPARALFQQRTTHPQPNRSHDVIQNFRNSDPPTSALAGQEVETRGLARRHRTMCLDHILKTPGQTAREIEDELGIKAHKRLPELRRGGLVRNGKPRPCSVSGRLALTWHPHIINPQPGAVA